MDTVAAATKRRPNGVANGAGADVASGDETMAAIQQALPGVSHDLGAFLAAHFAGRESMWVRKPSASRPRTKRDEDEEEKPVGMAAPIGAPMMRDEGEDEDEDGDDEGPSVGPMGPPSPLSSRLTEDELAVLGVKRARVISDTIQMLQTAAHQIETAQRVETTVEGRTLVVRTLKAWIPGAAEWLANNLEYLETIESTVDRTLTTSGRDRWATITRDGYTETRSIYGEDVAALQRDLARLELALMISLPATEDATAYLEVWTFLGPATREIPKGSPEAWRTLRTYVRTRGWDRLGYQSPGWEERSPDRLRETAITFLLYAHLLRALTRIPHRPETNYHLEDLVMRSVLHMYPGADTFVTRLDSVHIPLQRILAQHHLVDVDALVRARFMGLRWGSETEPQMIMGPTSMQDDTWGWPQRRHIMGARWLTFVRLLLEPAHAPQARGLVSLARHALFDGIQQFMTSVQHAQGTEALRLFFEICVKSRWILSPDDHPEAAVDEGLVGARLYLWSFAVFSVAAASGTDPTILTTERGPDVTDPCGQATTAKEGLLENPCRWMSQKYHIGWLTGQEAAVALYLSLMLETWARDLEREDDTTVLVEDESAALLRMPAVASGAELAVMNRYYQVCQPLFQLLRESRDPTHGSAPAVPRFTNIAFSFPDRLDVHTWCYIAASILPTPDVDPLPKAFQDAATQLVAHWSQVATQPPPPPAASGPTPPVWTPQQMGADLGQFLSEPGPALRLAYATRVQRLGWYGSGLAEPDHAWTARLLMMFYPHNLLMGAKKLLLQALKQREQWLGSFRTLPHDDRSSDDDSLRWTVLSEALYATAAWDPLRPLLPADHHAVHIHAILSLLQMLRHTAPARDWFDITQELPRLTDVATYPVAMLPGSELKYTLNVMNQRLRRALRTMGHEDPEFVVRLPSLERTVWVIAEALRWVGGPLRDSPLAMRQVLKERRQVPPPPSLAAAIEARGMTEAAFFMLVIAPMGVVTVPESLDQLRLGILRGAPTVVMLWQLATWVIRMAKQKQSAWIVRPALIEHVQPPRPPFRVPPLRGDQQLEPEELALAAALMTWWSRGPAPTVPVPSRTLLEFEVRTVPPQASSRDFNVVWELERADAIYGPLASQGGMHRLFDLLATNEPLVAFMTQSGYRVPTVAEPGDVALARIGKIIWFMEIGAIAQPDVRVSTLDPQLAIDVLYFATPRPHSDLSPEALLMRRYRLRLERMLMLTGVLARQVPDEPAFAYPDWVRNSLPDASHFSPEAWANILTLMGRLGIGAKLLQAHREVGFYVAAAVIYMRLYGTRHPPIDTQALYGRLEADIVRRVGSGYSALEQTLEHTYVNLHALVTGTDPPPQINPVTAIQGLIHEIHGILLHHDLTDPEMRQRDLQLLRLADVTGGDENVDAETDFFTLGAWPLWIRERTDETQDEPPPPATPARGLSADELARAQLWYLSTMLVRVATQTIAGPWEAWISGGGVNFISPPLTLVDSKARLNNWQTAVAAYVALALDYQRLTVMVSRSPASASPDWPTTQRNAITLNRVDPNAMLRIRPRSGAVADALGKELKRVYGRLLENYYRWNNKFPRSAMERVWLLVACSFMGYYTPPTRDSVPYGIAKIMKQITAHQVSRASSLEVVRDEMGQPMDRAAWPDPSRRLDLRLQVNADTLMAAKLRAAVQALVTERRRRRRKFAGWAPMDGWPIVPHPEMFGDDMRVELLMLERHWTVLGVASQHPVTTPLSLVLKRVVKRWHDRALPRARPFVSEVDKMEKIVHKWHLFRGLIQSLPWYGRDDSVRLLLDAAAVYLIVTRVFADLAQTRSITMAMTQAAMIHVYQAPADFFDRVQRTLQRVAADLSETVFGFRNPSVQTPLAIDYLQAIRDTGIIYRHAQSVSLTHHDAVLGIQKAASAYLVPPAMPLVENLEAAVLERLLMPRWIGRDHPPGSAERTRLLLIWRHATFLFRIAHGKTVAWGAYVASSPREIAAPIELYPVLDPTQLATIIYVAKWLDELGSAQTEREVVRLYRLDRAFAAEYHALLRPSTETGLIPRGD